MAYNNIDASKLKKPASIDGTGADDKITGSGFNDTINAGAGNDLVAGGNGDDTVYGGIGNDTLWGDSFSNSNSNDNGQDKLYGGDGIDQIHGGNGKDYLQGDAGNDKMWGDNGSDVLFGGAGGDELWGGNAGDTFVYKLKSDSTAAVSPAGTWSDTTGDWIHDFNGGEGDKLDFTGFSDPDLGSDKLTWNGDTAGAHKIWSDGHYVYADTNGDTTADLVIKVEGVGVGGIVGINHAPTDGDESNSVTEDVTLPVDLTVADGNLLANANDPDGDDLDVTVTGAAADNTYVDFDVSVEGTYGTLYVNTETGAYHYELDHDLADSLAKDEQHDENFTYEVSDGFGGTNSSTLKITVTGTNDAPVADDEVNATNEDATLTVDAANGVLIGDTDVDALDVLTVTTFTVDGDITVYNAGDVATIADVGTLQINADGSYEFIPAANYAGEVPVATYTVSDGNGGEDTGTLTLTVDPLNDGAGTVTIDGTAQEGETLTAIFADNDPDGAAQGGSVHYQWQADGTDIAGAADQNTYVLTVDEVGKVITVEVSYTDGQGFAENIESAATDAVVADGPPAVPPPNNGTGDPNDFDSLATGPNPQGGALNDTNDSHTLYGGAGNDTINGKDGNDLIYGGPGDDTLNGQKDLDTIYGGSGGDTLNGGTEADTIYGGSGIDTINGGGGDDIIIGGWGADLIDVNDGNDTVRFLSNDDTGDVISNFAAGDVLDFSPMDANTTNAPLTNDVFLSLVDAGSTATVTAFSLTYFDVGGNTKIWADTDGNTSTVELEITLNGFTGSLTGSVLL